MLGPESGVVPRGDRPSTGGKRWVLRILLRPRSRAAPTVKTRVWGSPEACRLSGPQLPARPSLRPRLLPRSTAGKSWALVITLAAAETSHEAWKPGRRNAPAQGPGPGDLPRPAFLLAARFSESRPSPMLALSGVTELGSAKKENGQYQPGEAAASTLPRARPSG